MANIMFYLFYLGFFILGLSLFLFSYAFNFLKKDSVSREGVVTIASFVLVGAVITFGFTFFVNYKFDLRFDLIAITSLPYVGLACLFYFKREKKIIFEPSQVSQDDETVNNAVMSIERNLSSFRKNLRNDTKKLERKIEELEKRTKTLEERKTSRYQHISDDT